MESLIVALDLEGTIVQDNRDPRPRPGLRKFLDLLAEIPVRVVMMTTVPEDKFREIAKGLVAQGDAPEWFSQVEFVNWERPYKSLEFIPGSELGISYLVDDYPGYVNPDQISQWIPIDTFFEQGDEDRELERVGLEILALVPKSKPN